MKLLRLKIFSLTLVLGLLSAARGHAQAQQAPAARLPVFDVASVKPNHSVSSATIVNTPPGGFTARGATARFLLSFAYHVREFQIIGGPGWINSEKYDIDAKGEVSGGDESPKTPPSQNMGQVRLRLQSLLADRFKLRVSHTTNELPVYALIVAKNGPKIREAKPDDTYPDGIKGADGQPQGSGAFRNERGRLTLQGLPISFLVRLLSDHLGRTVLDQTGLNGNYNIALQWTPDLNPASTPVSEEGGRPSADNAPLAESSEPSIFTAVQEQLGLKLVSTKAPVDVIVIDHIERPSEN